MEALTRLSNVNPSNPTGDQALGDEMNKKLAGVIQGYQDWGAGNKAAVSQASPTIGQMLGYADQVAATPGLGAVVSSGLGGMGALSDANNLGRDIMLRNAWNQPTLDPNVLQALKARPELMEWYKGATTIEQKKNIVDFITRNFVRQ
jgi:hypothetical protein